MGNPLFLIMGCLNSTGDDNAVSSGGNKSAYVGVKGIGIRAGTGKAGQGVSELKQNYVISKHSQQLGAGAFGSVFKTSNIHNPNHHVAIKVLDKNKLESNIDCIMEEVAILHTLDHPNICKYYETYDDNKYIYLVMEYISGCQLFTKITQQSN